MKKKQREFCSHMATEPMFLQRPKEDLNRGTAHDQQANIVSVKCICWYGDESGWHNTCIIIFTFNISYKNALCASIRSNKYF